MNSGCKLNKVLRQLPINYQSELMGTMGKKNICNMWKNHFENLLNGLKNETNKKRITSALNTPSAQII